MRSLIRRWRAPKGPKGPSKGQPKVWSKARRWRLWPRRSAQFGILGGLGFAAAVAGFAVWAVLAGQPADALRWAEARIADAGRGLGLVVDEVYVKGRVETARKDLRAALDVKRGDSIFAVDLERVRARIERLGWVREVRVRRLLPDTIGVEIVERRPLALWQDQRRLRLIDADGAVITARRLDRFRELPLLVGAEANRHAAAVLDMLGRHPALMRRVESVVRVRGMRWNVVLKNGVEIKLPERNPAAAWARLDRLQAREAVLDRDIAGIDLRFANRLVVRLSRAAAERRAADGKDT